MKNNGKLRLSYSLLLLVSQGRWNEAVDLYTHKKTIQSQAMEEGLEFHKNWAKEIQDTHKLQINNTTLKFKNPLTELERTVEYNDRWDLKGTFDVLDNNILYELKSGVLSSLEYATGYQIPIYFLIGDRLNMDIEQARIVHYNQHNKKADISIVWNTAPQIEKATNFIDSFAYEIEVFFRERGLIL